MNLFVRLLTFVVCGALSAHAQGSRDMLIIVSDPGEAVYQSEFHRQAQAWQNLAAKGNFKCQTIGLAESSSEDDLTTLTNTLNQLEKTGDDLWLIWIGHGSFDGRTANFNLRGKDIDAPAVQKLLKPFSRRLIILNLFSASFPFLPPLVGENRIIVGPVRSPNQRNYTRFGEKIADALEDSTLAADLDLDGALSLLELTLQASSQTKAFYDDEQRVVQENAIIEDNGDGSPTEVTTFEGLISTAGEDGPTAREIYLLAPSESPKLSAQAKKDRSQIEQAINALRQRKPHLPEDEYYRQLEALMREMAKIYRKKPR
ncbi:MAG: hypothetical protein AAGC74_00105 [Verrucomicrobiota bacterium]